MNAFDMFAPESDSIPPVEAGGPDDLLARLEAPPQRKAAAPTQHLQDIRTVRLPEDMAFAQPKATRVLEPSTPLPERSAGTRLLVEQEDLLTTCTKEYDQIMAEVRELRMLIQSSVQEVAKLNQRKIESARVIEDMEQRLRMYSREAIRDAYIAASESEMRIFMMSEQLDQMRAKLRAYEKYETFLKRTIDLIETLPTQQERATAPEPLPQMAAEEFVSSEPNYDLELLHTRMLDLEELEQLRMRAQPRQSVPMSESASTARIIQAEEDVRRKVSQSLHEKIMQSLVNLALSAEICEKTAQEDRDATLVELGHLKELIHSTLQEATQSMLALRPMQMSGQGLITAIRRYASAAGAENHLDVQFAAPNQERPLEPDHALAVFRIAQEAITNVVRHSHAESVAVTVLFDADTLTLTVEDSGDGFDVDAVLARATRHETTGIMGMLERAELLGGVLRVNSTPGNGTRIEMQAPLA